MRFKTWRAISARPYKAEMRQLQIMQESQGRVGEGGTGGKGGGSSLEEGSSSMR